MDFTPFNRCRYRSRAATLVKGRPERRGDEDEPSFVRRRRLVKPISARRRG